ncbi:hypothetical protein VPH35_113657 [Triticum aestivum]|uniref:Uncharacterized protein n=3 Tax=Triticum TaxID=4564 RepID=A0A9R0YWU6_TRITD|nr:unnamed protein product [Triticum turgidum subsp. durum]
MSIGRSISAGQLRHRTRVFVVAQDPSEVGNLVFKINLKHLFSCSPSQPEPPEEEEPHAQPEAVACLKQVDNFERMTFAASASGDVIVAANYAGCGRTLIYDAAAGGVSPGPEMRSVKNYLFLVPVGDRTFFAMSAYSRLDVPKGGPWFEVLQQQLLPGGGGGGGRWAWSAVPDPPGLPRGQREDVRAYFVAGARVWISLRLQGTYSFDTARQRWRKEGAWMLPVLGRAVLVPDFLGSGRRLLFGIRSMRDHQFCAVDMDARPPTVLRSWPEALPTIGWAAGYKRCSFLPQVTYFGGGRFCVSVTNQTNEENPLSVASFKAVELTADLQLIERRSSYYLMPQSSRGSPVTVI